MQRQAGQTAGYIAVRTESAIAIGTAVPVSEAAWIAPRHLDYHLICAGEGSTLTRTTEASYEVELVGLRKKRCPGTPVAGSIQGRLSSEPASGGL
jgi:hypothetical protein